MEEEKQLTEIDIDSPINIRKAHAKSRKQWNKKQREQERKEADSITRKKRRMQSKRMGLCNHYGCTEKPEKDRTKCKKHLMELRKYNGRYKKKRENEENRSNTEN